MAFEPSYIRAIAKAKIFIHASDPALLVLGNIFDGKKSKNDGSSLIKKPIFNA